MLIEPRDKMEPVLPIAVDTCWLVWVREEGLPV